MIRRFLLALSVALVGLASSSSAQCSELDIQTRLDPSETFQAVRIAVSSSIPEAPHVLVLSRAPGETVLDLGGSKLVLDLASPLRAMRLGTSDRNGELVRLMRMPADLGITIYAQTVGFGVGIRDREPVLRFCTSNVAKMEL